MLKCETKRTLTSLGQKVSETGSLTEARWTQRLEAGSCPFRNPAARQAAVPALRETIVGQQAANASQQARQARRRQRDLDIHRTDHIKLSAKKPPCFQLGIYPPCVRAPIMRGRHHDECRRFCAKLAGTLPRVISGSA